MSNMFKKTLVAAALTAFAASSHAVVVGTNNADNAPTVASTEFVASKVAETTAANRKFTLPTGAITIDPEVAYVAGDIIELTVSGAKLVAGNLPTITNSGTGVVQFQGISASNANTLVFAVTTGFAATETLTVGNLELQATDLASSVSFAYRATNSTGTVLKDNSGTTSAVVLTTRSQYSASITEKLDAKVDTAKRSRFVSNGTTDTFKFKVANRAAIAPATAGVWSTTLVITDVARLNVTVDGAFGSFTNADGDRQNVLSCGNIGAAPSNVTAAADEKTKLALRYTDASVAGPLDTEVTCTFNLANVTSDIPLSDFKTTLQFATASASRFSVTGLDTGKFTLDGAVVNIPYLPFGEGITHVVNVTNSGSVSGDIFAEAIDRTGKKYGPVKVGVATAGAQVALGATLGADLVKAGLPANERAQVTLVVNVPESAITAYSAYNVGGTGARIVVNSTNGK